MAEDDKSPESEDDTGDSVKRVRFEIGALPIPLKKTGAALDRLLSLPLDAAANWVERKFNENINEHLEAVTRSRKSRNKNIRIEKDQVSIDNIADVKEWAWHAGRVEGRDRVLSAAWRAALDRILDGDDEEFILQTLSTLPKPTLRYFLRGAANINSGQKYFLILI